MPSKLKRLILQAVAGVLYHCGVFALWRFFRQKILRRKEVCVLGLHRVLSESEHSRSHSLDGIILRDTTFIEMLEFLKRNFTMLSLDGFLHGDWGDKGRSRHLCLLSFDDGWRDNYTTAFPWLKKFGIPATVFLVTGMIEGRRTFWVERLIRAWKNASHQSHIYAVWGGLAQRSGNQVDLQGIIEYLKHLPAAERQRTLDRIMPPEDASDQLDGGNQMLTWSQVVEMSQGGIEFGAHTVTHPLLPYEDDTTIVRELQLAKQTIEEKLGRPARTFAYPNGDWDKRVRQRVMEAGYECAFTTTRGWYRQGQDPFTIHRILLHEGNVTGRSGEFSPAMFSLTLARGN